MKHRGIVFSGHSIPLIQSGAKTQTRRLIKKDRGATRIIHVKDRPLIPGSTDRFTGWVAEVDGLGVLLPIKQPLCNPGDLAWIREAWRTFRNYDHLKPSELLDLSYGRPEQHIHYLADPLVELGERGITISGRYRHAWFMPRAFARVWLKILDVRPERLLQITDEGCRAEGMTGDGEEVLDKFAVIWDGLHEPPNDWAGNPWCWVYTFERTEQPS